MIDLTKNEIAAMKMCIAYGTRNEQHSDNHSDANPADIGIRLGWNRQQVGGLLASLILKGMVFVDDRTGEGDPILCNPDFHIVYLTKSGVDAIFDIIELAAKLEPQNPTK
jgi:hypothetical protein